MVVKWNFLMFVYSHTLVKLSALVREVLYQWVTVSVMKDSDC